MVDKGIPIRLVLYSVAILYLVVDFFVIGGPLRRAVFPKKPQSEEVIEAAKSEGVVARVYFQPILLSQVDRRVEEDLWVQGRSLEEVNPPDRLTLRRAALNVLIDLHLLRLKVRFNQDQVPVEEEEIEAELARFTNRFATEAEFQASLQRQGWSEKELRYRVAARIQQENYLRSMIEVEVSEEEAGAWFEDKKEELAVPERVRARQIFLATLERDPDLARSQLEEAKRKIEARAATFAELAAELSDDPRSKDRGGDLGWMQAGRLPRDFREPLFAMEVGPLHLIRTRIGWHLVEVLEKKPRTARSFAEARADVVAALEAVKRDRGVKLYRQQLRGRDRHKIEIFKDVLERDLDRGVE